MPDMPMLHSCLMKNIQASCGLSVKVRPRIVISMRDGFEIGSRDAHSAPHAEIVPSRVRALQTSVEVLSTLDGQQGLDDQFTRNVLRVPHE